MLIKCPECGKEVSDKAAACIHCGYPLAPQPEASPKWCPKCGTYHLAGVTQCNIVEPVSLDDLDEEIPKIQCPTCNSSDVEKVSATAKATNVMLFGIYGNTRKKQFRCRRCGYMW